MKFYEVDHDILVNLKYVVHVSRYAGNLFFYTSADSEPSYVKTFSTYEEAAAEHQKLENMIFN